jgi:hypothetical protein
MRWLILAPLEKKSCQGFFYQKTFSYLIELGHEIVGYVADKPLKTSPVFPDSIYINNLIFYSEKELNYEIQKDKKSNCIDEVEKYLRNAEFLHTYLRITDRMMANPQSAGLRLRMFRLTLSYWINLLNKHSIDTVFFGSTPHFGFDTLLAMLCYEKKVKVLYSARTEFDGMYFIRENWKNLMALKRVKKYSLSIDSVVMNANWIKYSRNLVDESLLHNKQLDDSYIYKIKDKIIFYLKLFKRTINILLKTITYRSIESSSFMSEKNYIGDISLFLKRKKQSRQQWNSYRKLSSSFNLPKNYIFFPLSFQPERSTDPEAGVFADLEFSIQYIIESLPKNWYLVIKEHPRQFDGKNTDLRKLHARGKDFYNFNARLSQVRYSPLELDSLELIKFSRGCIVNTGSVGYESALVGKPVGCLSFPWYSGYAGCYDVSNRLKLNNFISVCQNNTNGKFTSQVFLKYIKRIHIKFSFKMPSKIDSFNKYPVDRLKEDARALATALNYFDFSSLKK